MSSALEQRMTAMRARLNNLSATVDLNDEERAQNRLMAHRYYHQSDQPVAATSVPRPHAPATLRERDVNLSTGGGVQRGDVKPLRCPGALSSISSNMDTGSVGGVPAMLQLARQHASPAHATRHREPSSLTLHSAGTKSPAEVRAAPLSPTAAHLDSSGLHAYEFRERFPIPRGTPPPATTTTTAATSAVAAAAEGRSDAPCQPPTTPRGSPGEHRYAQGTFVTPLSANASFVSASSTRSSATASDAPFDAFRVVQARLRQKMQQLTSAAPPAAVAAPLPSTELSTAGDVRDVAPSVATKRKSDVLPPHAFVYDDSSPPPRPPPGTRAETATPIRSREMPADVSHNTTLAPPSSVHSPVSSDAARALEDHHTPTVVELSGAYPPFGNGEQDSGDEEPQRHTLFDPEDTDTNSEGESRRPREYMYETYSISSRNSPAQPESLTAVRKDGEREGAAREGFLKAKSSTAPGAFSDPTSATASHQRSQVADAPANGRVAQESRRLHSGSMRSASPSQRNAASLPRRMARSSCAAPNGSARVSHRTSSSASPSSSHTRERSSTGSQPPRPSTSALRPKPISLNVEATILASVTGAELFALLRMRGLIDSEGDTEEYRLPPTRCHRLYVTANELRQLQLLRQSIQAQEEEQRPVPSYQRPTVAARSRHAEFSPPPPVSQFMER